MDIFERSFLWVNELMFTCFF